MFSKISACLATALVIGAASVALSAPADEMPKFDAATTCRAERAVSVVDVSICLQDEHDAADQLSKKWMPFATSDRVECIRASTDVGGMQSYVELLTCIEMAQDARKLSR